MNLFRDTYYFQNSKDSNKGQGAGRSLYAPWQEVDIISSNCPRHVGVRLRKIADNHFECPKGGEKYKATGSVANQTSKDRYDIGIDILKQ